MAKKSRDKGKVGEREVAALLRSHGFAARRGVQFSGGAGSPDVVHDIPGLHIEVKRVEKINLNSAMSQATEDAKGLTPVVIHRTSRQPWYATVGADWLFATMQQRQQLFKTLERRIDLPVVVKDQPDDSDFERLRAKVIELQQRVREYEDNVSYDAGNVGQSEQGGEAAGQEGSGGKGDSIAFMGATDTEGSGP